MKLTKTSKAGPTLLGARGSRNFLKINIFMRKKKEEIVWLLPFFFFGLAPFILFMRHEQCIKTNKQCFVSVNSNHKLFFYCFLFLIFSKINGIQTHLIALFG